MMSRWIVPLDDTNTMLIECRHVSETESVEPRSGLTPVVGFYTAWGETGHVRFDQLTQVIDGSISYAMHANGVASTQRALSQAANIARRLTLRGASHRMKA
jgi:hypothetical protein